MKYLYIFLFLLTFHNEQNHNAKNVIVFEHTGDERSITKTLLVSIKKIEIPLHTDDYATLKQTTGRSKFTDQEKEWYFNIKYDRLITTYKTFFAIEEFLNRNKEYSINNSTHIDKPGIQSYHILYNGIEYRIYSKLKIKFFNDLKNYLIKERCDLKVAQAISHLN